MAAKSNEQNEATASLKAIAGLVGGNADDDRTTQRLLNDRVRLGLLSCLAVTDTLSFRELRDILDVTDGNLSVHARKLEEGGLIAHKKRFDGRIPKTEFRLTSTGRTALERHLAHMEALIKATNTSS